MTLSSRFSDFDFILMLIKRCQEYNIQNNFNSAQLQQLMRQVQMFLALITFLVIQFSIEMIQIFITDPLVHHFMAPCYPIFIQIRYLLGTITNKKSMKTAKSDIISLVSKQGPEAQRFVLLSLMEMIDFKQNKDKAHIQAKIGFLSELLKQYASHTAFLSYFPEVIIQVVSDPSKLSQYLTYLIQSTKIPLQTQITVSLALYLSDRKQVSEVGEKQLQKKLKEFRQTGKGNDIPQKILEQILFQINQNPSLQEKLGIQFDYLLANCENIQKVPQTKIYKYLKCDWQYFASEQITIEKPVIITIRKVDILRDLGTSATLSVQTMKTVLSDLGPLTEEQIFQCLMYMTGDKYRSDTGVQKFITDLLVANKKNIKGDELKKVYCPQLGKKLQNGWNFETFLSYCNQAMPNLKWQSIMNQLDRPKLAFQNEQHFVNLMKFFQRAKKQGQKFKFPEHIFFKKWNNLESQSVFLVNLFKCREIQVVGLNESQNKKIQRSARDAPIAKQIWGYLDLVQLLIQTSQYNYLEVRALFQFPVMKLAELLIQTLSQIRPSQGQALLDELFSVIFPTYLHNHSNNIRLLESLWEANQELFIGSICELYKSQNKKQNSINLSRVLDIAQVIKQSLIPLTNWNDYDFAVPLAILAGKRQFLHFQPWITDRIKNVGNPFLKSTLGYIEDHLLSPIRKLIQTRQSFSYEFMLQKAQLSKQLLAFILQSIFLTTSSSKMTKRNLQSLKKIYKEVCQYFPEMTESQMPDEIQQLAERQFRKIYKKQITIAEAIQHMAKLKSSQKAQDKQLFASMITFMYSELRFHASYPQNQLMITANLFAGIINENLIEKKLFQVLLQVLQDDLKQDNKKYLFAKMVIEQIRDKLSKEPQFCEKLLDNYHFLQKDPQTIQFLIRSVEPPMNLSIEKEKKLKQAMRTKNSPLPEPHTLIPSLEEETLHTAPNVDVVKKPQNCDYDILTTLDKTKQILFAEKDSKLSKINTTCNTLSLTNVEDKAKDLQKIIGNDRNIIKLLAYNIVFKRIPLAQNNGMQIFNKLVQRIPRLQKPILSITYKILQAWFKLTDKSINDKRLINFKAIGSWLGKLTIARGQPVAINKLNLRQILVNSYTHCNARLPYNISVVVKIVEHITLHKQIFRVSNPWLSRILGTLNEIQEKLKEQHQNSKSEIKAFFLNTDIKRHSSLLPSTAYLDRTNATDPMNEYPLISKLTDYIKVDAELYNTYMAQGIDLKMIITKAVDDSIQQIVQPVIDRAVKIALVTTKQLMMKDFALQPDSQKFRTSCYNVVKKLAGPLAQVTCREPLKASMNRTLKNYLAPHSKDPNQIQTIINRAITDNLDLGCALIKKAVIQSGEEAIRKDDLINQSIQQRLQAQQKNTAFRDQNYLSEIPSIVPEELRPKLGGLSFEQFLVYDQMKNSSTKDKLDQLSHTEKLNELLCQKNEVKTFKQLLQSDPSLRDQLLAKVFQIVLNPDQNQFSKQGQPAIRDQNDVNYYLEVLQTAKQYVSDPEEPWATFKSKADLLKRQNVVLAKKIVRLGLFPESALQELQTQNQEESKAINLFQKWLSTAHQQIQPFLQSLEQIFNKSQNQIRNFFEYSLIYALQKVQNSISHYHQSIDTTFIEDYSKLIIISYKLIASNNCSLYLEHTLQAIIQVFNKYQSSQDAAPYFQRAFFKLFLNLICDATRKEYDFTKQKITTFYYILAKQFHKINPLLYPNFTYAWVELISNKYFLPTLLQKYEYWDLYFQLLCDLLKFVKQNLTEENITKHKQYQTFYNGIIKLFIVLIHDFSDFLSAFSLQLCLHIPDKFIQMRNMVISAYPKDMKFQNPSAIKSREELQYEPNIVNLPKYYKLKFDKPKFNQWVQLISGSLKDKDKQKSLKQLRAMVETESDQTLQFFVLYFAWNDGQQYHFQSVNQSRKLLIELIANVDNQSRDNFIKFALNLIRYPNVITAYFIDFVIHIVFKSSNDKSSDKLRNILLKKTLERMNVEDPHAWGMLYLVKQFQIQKNQLKKMQIPNQVLQIL